MLHQGIRIRTVTPGLLQPTGQVIRTDLPQLSETVIREAPRSNKVLIIQTGRQYLRGLIVPDGHHLLQNPQAPDGHHLLHVHHLRQGRASRYSLQAQNSQAANPVSPVHQNHRGAVEANSQVKAEQQAEEAARARINRLI